MNMKRLLPTLIIASTIVGVSYFVVSIYRQSVANTARYQCAQSSRYSVTSVNPAGETIEVWYPVQDLYQQCLAEKGL